MILRILATFVFLFSVSSSFAENAPVFSDADLKKYGRGPSERQASDHENIVERNAIHACKVVSFNTYENVMKQRISHSGSIATTNRFGNMSSTYIAGGSSSIIADKETCLSITVENKNAYTKTLHTSDITVKTGKGNTFSPRASGSNLLDPGESITISDICFGTKLSPPLTVSCRY